MNLTLPRLRRQPTDPAVEAERTRARTAEVERRREQDVRDAAERQQSQARRLAANEQRLQAAGAAARAALAWGANAWLETSMWLCLVLGLQVDYIASYSDLIATAEAFGYPSPISWIMPLSIDLPATSSVLGQIMAARWKSPWYVRVCLGILTLTTAPLTLVGNALRARIVIAPDARPHFTFDPANWSLVAFAVPGAGVVLLGFIGSLMQAEKAGLHARQEKARLAAEAAEAADAEARRREVEAEYERAHDHAMSEEMPDGRPSANGRGRGRGVGRTSTGRSRAKGGSARRTTRGSNVRTNVLKEHAHQAWLKDRHTPRAVLAELGGVSERQVGRWIADEWEPQLPHVMPDIEAGEDASTHASEAGQDKDGAVPAAAAEEVL